MSHFHYIHTKPQRIKDKTFQFIGVAPSLVKEKRFINLLQNDVFLADSGVLCTVSPAVASQLMAIVSFFLSRMCYLHIYIYIYNHESTVEHILSGFLSSEYLISGNSYPLLHITNLYLAYFLAVLY